MENTVLQNNIHLHNGLVSYWPLDGNSTDAIGNNDGTDLNGVTYTEGKINNCASFNGTSSYIRVPNIDFTTQLTVSCWVKFNSTVGYSSLIGNWQNTGGGDSWILTNQNNPRIHFFTSDSTNSIFCQITEPGNYTTDVWYHYVGVFNSGVQILYRDGVEVVRDNDAGFTTLYQNNNEIWLGHYDTNYLNGFLDEVSIWNRALSEREIKRLYNGGRGLSLISKSGGAAPPSEPEGPIYGTLNQTGLVLDLHSGDPVSYPGTGTSWFDKSPAASAASVISLSPVYTNGADPNKYFTLTGTQFVTTPINIQGATNANLQTIGAWHKGMVANQVYFGTNAASSGQSHLCVRVASATTIRFEGSYYGGGTGESVVTSGTLTPNASGWNYVVAVKTASSLYDVYFNGVRVMTNIMRNSTGSVAFICLGKVYNTFIGPSVHGALHVYNRALTGQEILDNYNAQLPYYSL